MNRNPLTSRPVDPLEATNRSRERKWRNAPDRARAIGTWSNMVLFMLAGGTILYFGGWVQGSIYLILGLFLLVSILGTKRMIRRMVRKTVINSIPTCPECQKPVIVENDEIRCTGCAFTHDIAQTERKLREIARHTSVPDPKREWTPLSVGQMESPWWLRLMGLASVIALGAFPIHATITQRIDQSVWILAAFGLFAILTALGFAWQSTRKDQYLRSRRFRVCPRCKKTLQRAAAARHDPGAFFDGECPRCGIAYTQEWLEDAWSDLARAKVESEAAAEHGATLRDASVAENPGSPI